MLTDADIQSHAARIRDDGYTVIERAASPDLVEGLKAAVLRIEREHNLAPARTSFEGFKTLRINNLLTYDDLFWEVPLHDNVLPVVERVLDRECLLSSFCSLVLGPGQEAQPIHEDTQLIPLPRPHIPITINAIWALSDFREDNGATRIIPRSHKFDSSPEYGKEYDAVTATMPAGSVMLFDSALWHGGGANTSDARRFAFSPAPIAGAGCGNRRTCNSVFRARPRPAFRAVCRNCAATASTRGSSATSTITIRSSCSAASVASGWCGRRPTSGRRGWRGSNSLRCHGRARPGHPRLASRTTSRRGQARA
ncbi:phytanoyl-CoA dioxygenase family protein [Bradyrhizobium elkanii]